MSEKSAARRLQRETGAPYQKCLDAVRATVEQAKEVKAKHPEGTWTDAACAAARPLLAEKMTGKP